MKVGELRQRFIDYFKSKDHTVVPSSSLVPIQDDSLLFTNAGMVPFKEVFLGREKRDYVRAVSAQRCVRAGGKHNDLENVGYTARHHTFFEMLGNFSFGDYFKAQAIRYSWEFLTQVLKLPEEKLWVTVYKEDPQAELIWLNELKVDPSRFSRCGEADNFWAMGDTGPCGPCSEIFYDHGPTVEGGPPGSEAQEGDRYVEIWNLVFMQFNRAKDGKLSPLPKPCVDTGMGLERLAAVLQGVHSNYEIDLFQALIQKAAQYLNCQNLAENSLKVISDHIRSSAFLIADGVLPSNEGRGYVLRRIIRRALRHGHKLGTKHAFFYRLVEPLIEQMGQAYPELHAQGDHIKTVLEKEEAQFEKTLDQGLKLLEHAIASQQGDKISGDVVFKLYDTYGFPMDLTRDIARENGLSIDEAGFDAHMAKQRARARSASQFGVDYNEELHLEETTEFTGYSKLCESAQIVKILKKGESVSQLLPQEEGGLVLDHTPFYAESGGQVGDVGHIEASQAQFEVWDTQKSQKAHIHVGKVLQGTIEVGQTVKAQVNVDHRQAVVRHHSATHLLHAALRQVLGAHVTQKGSLVESSRLRFDFTHFEPLTLEQLHQISQLVNDQIQANTAAQVEYLDKEEALKKGAMALFGEKYDQKVRVLDLGQGFSIELCGGTHVARTGDIGCFVITAQMGIAAGVRRIEALTGPQALKWMAQKREILENISQFVKGTPENVEQKVQQLSEKLRVLEKENAQLKVKLASNMQGDLKDKATKIGEVSVVSEVIMESDPKHLRQLMDNLKSQLNKAVIVLGCATDKKVSLIAGVTKDVTDRFHAGQLVNWVSSQVGGKGGGRPDMAQAGGDQPQNLSKAIASVHAWVKEKMDG